MVVTPVQARSPPGRRLYRNRRVSHSAIQFFVERTENEHHAALLRRHPPSRKSRRRRREPTSRGRLKTARGGVTGFAEVVAPTVARTATVRGGDVSWCSAHFQKPDTSNGIAASLTTMAPASSERYRCRIRRGCSAPRPALPISCPIDAFRSRVTGRCRRPLDIIDGKRPAQAVSWYRNDGHVLPPWKR